VAKLLENETIIYFGPEPWAGLWRNRHQLMSRFAGQNDVWYVEPPTMLRGLLGLRRNGDAPPAPRRTRLFSRDASGVRIFHSPWWLPITGRAPFKDISIRIFLAVISLVARIGANRRAIVWFSRPTMVDYLGKLPAKSTIYHVVDEYGGYGHPTKMQSKPDDKEIEMLQTADAVVVVTPTLFDLKSPHNANTFVVPNAVDHDAYADRNLPSPDDITEIGGPIIGYSGLIAARLDLELLIDAAEARPDWNFVFVGSVNDQYCETGLQKLRDMSNVHFLGHKPVHDVPQYVRRFDVCIIPYVLNLRAQHASPLKLYEYAAASRPIVTTDFAAARSFDGHVRIARDANEFLRACEEALNLDASALEIQENLRMAAGNTWSHRVQQISEIIRGLDS